MNTQTAKILCEINNDFYRKNSASFSETRKAPWPGWKRCLALLEKTHFGEHEALSVFDLACGNLRFEIFFAEALPQTTVTFHAVDNCDSLVPSMPRVSYQSLDVLDLLQKGIPIGEQMTAPLCDLSVCFGFMHHVPVHACREAILLNLIKQTRSGGYVIASFWQFLNDPALAIKAQATHEQAMRDLGLPVLGPNDYLLGWKGIPGAYRYCHSFTDVEIDRLTESVADRATLISQFASDGRTDKLNTYLLFRVH